MAQVSGLKDPLTTLNMLLDAKVVVPDGEGYFTWDNSKFEQIVSS